MMPRQSGFTLLELLVALVVFGLLMVGLTQGTRFGLAAWQHQARTIDDVSGLDATARLLTRLIEQIDVGDSHDAPPIAGTAASFTFTSEMPMAAILPSHEADMRLLVDGAHHLILRWAPYTHATRIGPPPKPTDTVLLDGVDHVQFSYWPSPGIAGDGWLTDWTAAQAPALVRIRLVFSAARQPLWPDIVAAPMRQRP